MQGRMSSAKPAADPLKSATQHNEKNKKKTERIAGNRKINRAGRYAFFQEEFEQIMIENENTDLLDRLDSVIINHSVREESRSFFHIYWYDSEKHLHPLIVSFRTSEEFKPSYSKYLTDDNLKILVPGLGRPDFNKKQKYASLTVEEVDSREIIAENGVKKVEFYTHPLLLIWITLDGYFGEFRDTRTQPNMSVSEVLRIYRYFSKLFSADNIFIIDDAALSSETAESTIPLRLVALLATGKTLYEQALSGLQLMELKQFPLTTTDNIQQNKIMREGIINELQSLKIVDWYAMLNADQQKLLAKIFFRHFHPASAGSGLFRGSRRSDSSNLPFGIVTLQELAVKVYNDFKSTMSVTPSLELLHVLLCGDNVPTFGFVSSFEKQSDKWVKSRSHQLLRESAVWKFEPLPTKIHYAKSYDKPLLGA